LPAATLTKYQAELSYHDPETDKTIDVATEYRNAERQQGIGQEHLLCLGKGTPIQQFGDVQCEVGSRPWVKWSLDEIRRQIGPDQEIPETIDVHIWWGEKDSVVPRSARGMFPRSQSDIRRAYSYYHYQTTSISYSLMKYVLRSLRITVGKWREQGMMIL
jgi:hypothetical protein